MSRILCRPTSDPKTWKIILTWELQNLVHLPPTPWDNALPKLGNNFLNIDRIWIIPPIIKPKTQLQLFTFNNVYNF